MWRILAKLRKFILGKELALKTRNAKQIHVEAYHLDRVWEKIRQRAGENLTWYIMTPANYGYIRCFVGANLSKEELDEVLSSRAKWMQDNGYKLGLHVHFWKHAKMPTHLKGSLLKEAMAWGEKNGIQFKELVPGWWSVDEDLPQLCDDFGLKLIKKDISSHDYNL